MRQILIFTDLDGTLLDHHSYSYDAAKPALGTIRKLRIPLILSTSKTAAELRVLRHKLNLKHPFIVENGAAIFYPENFFSQPAGKDRAETGEKVIAHYFGTTYNALIDIVHRLREAKGYQFKGFADFSVAEVAAATGLDQGSALLAKSREGSEPISWQDSPEALSRFKEDLADHQLQITKGGRFYHVLPRVDKGQAVKWIIDQFRKCSPGMDFFTVALGDGLNDQPMLEVVDLAVILPSAGGDILDPAGVRTMRMTEPGPAGWNRAITEIIHELQPKGTEHE